MTRISVIIVNYGTADLVIDSVESVLAQDHGGRTVDVHLIDNGSPGDDAARLAEAHEARGWGGRVTLYAERENHGFGRGNNVALRAIAAAPAPPDFVFLLNPDARLANDAIAILADFLERHPDAVAAGAAVQRPDGTKVTAAFRFPSPMREFIGPVGIGALQALFPRQQVALAPDIARQPVDWVTGAAFMARFDAMARAGFFDPDFFLYFEETELMWRLNEKPGAVWYVPEARVEHVAGAATGMKGGRHVSRALPVYWYDSWRLYHVKTRGVGAARAAALLRLTAAAASRTLGLLRGGSDVPAHFFRDFGRNVLHPLFLGDPLMARPDGKTIRQRRA